jgi:hypothetical protein
MSYLNELGQRTAKQQLYDLEILIGNFEQTAKAVTEEKIRTNFLNLFETSIKPKHRAILDTIDKQGEDAALPAIQDLTTIVSRLYNSAVTEVANQPPPSKLKYLGVAVAALVAYGLYRIVGKKSKKARHAMATAGLAGRRRCRK